LTAATNLDITVIAFDTKSSTKDLNTLNQHRFKGNPDEEAFAVAFSKFAKANLGYLLEPVEARDRHIRPPEPSVRDYVVAETIIQWLGSPVGKGFLRDLGFEKRLQK
jgi:hypothetical protein